MPVPKDGGDAMRPEILAEVLQISKEIANITIKYKGAAASGSGFSGTFGWQDLCDHLPSVGSIGTLTGGYELPAASAAQFGGGILNWTHPYDLVFPSFHLPCSKYTPLDCFLEGAPPRVAISLNDFSRAAACNYCRRVRFPCAKRVACVGPE